jgi:hypothetical protein
LLNKYKNIRLFYLIQNIKTKSSETDQDQLDQTLCILKGICNDPADIDPFMKIAILKLICIAII